VSKPFSTELQAEDLLIDLDVDPARHGPADIHVYVLSSSGQVRDIPELRLELSLPAADVGPLSVPLERAGPGHYAAYGFDLPLAGTWTITAAARVDNFREVRARTTMEVR
jgi:copper transport protein